LGGFSVPASAFVSETDFPETSPISDKRIELKESGMTNFIVRNPQAMPKTNKKSASNALNTPGQSLKAFSLLDIQQYTKEKIYSSHASKDFHLFYVGRDDVHDILKYVLSRVTVSLYLNMFGYDDDELNSILWAKALDPTITMLITLDKSQSGGVHEKKLLASDIAQNPTAYNTHFVVGTSSTGQISHTKGFVADGIAAGEGSTNWSSSGEGTFIISGQIGGPGYKAQNNTQSIITDPDTISSFTAELVAEHMAARAIQPASLKSEQRVPEGTPPKPGMTGMKAAVSKSKPTAK
jgi:hypothetical protein